MHLAGRGGGACCSFASVFSLRSWSLSSGASPRFSSAFFCFPSIAALCRCLPSTWSSTTSGPLARLRLLLPLPWFVAGLPASAACCCCCCRPFFAALAASRCFCAAAAVVCGWPACVCCWLLLLLPSFFCCSCCFSLFLRFCLLLLALLVPVLRCLSSVFVRLVYFPSIAALCKCLHRLGALQPAVPWLGCGCCCRCRGLLLACLRLLLAAVAVVVLSLLLLLLLVAFALPPPWFVVGLPASAAGCCCCYRPFSVALAASRCSCACRRRRLPSSFLFLYLSSPCSLSLSLSLSLSVFVSVPVSALRSLRRLPCPAHATSIIVSCAFTAQTCGRQMESGFTARPIPVVHTWRSAAVF